MEKFTWEEKYSVGVDSIDEQHKNFFKIANCIIDLVEAGDFNFNSLLKAAGRLKDYAFYHLNYEEKYFDSEKYLDTNRHIAEHDAYRERVDYFWMRLTEGKEKMNEIDGKKLAKEIVNYSVHWLADHIIVVDRGYIALFKELGVK